MLDSLPANDKSFSRLLGEVPYLPESMMRLLVDLCSENYPGQYGRDGDRVTQGLGAVWSLILGRPPNRQACLDIALKVYDHQMFCPDDFLLSLSLCSCLRRYHKGHHRATFLGVERVLEERFNKRAF